MEYLATTRSISIESPFDKLRATRYSVLARS
jgi:hypothetical protein